jgi:hypothetical protein
MLKLGELVRHPERRGDKFGCLARRAGGEAGAVALYNRHQPIEGEDEPQLARRSAVTLDGGLYTCQALAQVIGGHDRHQLDLGVHPKEEPLGNIRDLR